MQALLEGHGGSALDGVTGRLSLGRDQQFARELTSAQFAEGKLLIFAGQQ